MAFNFSTTIAKAASAGLVLGALTGCGNNKGHAASPAGHEPAGAAAGAKACCKGQNACSGKGGCAVEGKHNCAGKNDCSGKGGCNAHCPK